MSKDWKIMSTSDSVQDSDLLAVYTVKSWNEPISVYTNKLKSSNSLCHRAKPKHLEADSATGSAAMRVIFSTQLQEQLYQASM